jgi:TonB family protein
LRGNPFSQCPRLTNSCAESSNCQERAMTAPSPGPSLFPTLTGENTILYRARHETFVYSMLGQAAALAIILYFCSCVIDSTPEIARRLPKLDDIPLIFSGHNGGGGGDRDPLPASRGNLPRASLETQIVSPTVRLPMEMPKLPVEATVTVAPDIKIPQSGQIGDPNSPFSQWLSNGPGGRDGIGTGCCGGVGPSSGPGVGDGPSGIYPAGKMGATVPEMIYNPEPSFSEEARKAKVQGIVLLLLVVGKDGRPSNIRVGQSLGMGLDEQAIAAVTRWRFRPATRNGQPVATQIAVEVDFHLY